MPARIYTRTGDSGETGLFGGARVGKDDFRVEAYGSIDELNTVLGIARAQIEDQDLAALVSRFQNQLFDIGADLATPEESGEEHGRIKVSRIGPEAAESLEKEIDRLEAGLAPLTRFILPGGSESAAYLHFARAVCRRAERRVVALARAESVNPEIVRYLNRLSDLLFVMARTANARLAVDDVVWES